MRWTHDSRLTLAAIPALWRYRAVSPTLVQRALHLYWRFSRGMTLGVRVAAFDAREQVFLVRHTYVAGWHLPGGGVEPGETIWEAAAKELREEGHLTMPAPPQLVGVYLNRFVSRRDHVAFLVARGVVQERPRLPDREIAEAAFFALDALPPDTTGATRRRLAELAGEAEPSPHW